MTSKLEGLKKWLGRKGRSSRILAMLLPCSRMVLPNVSVVIAWPTLIL